MAYTYGLTEILVAEVLATGKMPVVTTMTKIGEVLEGTANLAQEAGDKVEFREEGVSAPKVIIQKSGTWTFAFEIMNVDTKMLSDFIGGAVVGKTWTFDGTTKVVEKALFIKPKVGLYWQIPRASISATIGGDMNEDGLITLSVTVTPLAPAAKEPAMIVGEVKDLTV